MQTQWASQLDPVLANLLVQGQLLQNISLINGTTAINHKLGRKLQGWMIVGINGIAAVYDTQASNQTPALTLQLVSNAAVTVNLWVF
jgi:hypothetical protein